MIFEKQIIRMYCSMVYTRYDDNVLFHAVESLQKTDAKVFDCLES